MKSLKKINIQRWIIGLVLLTVFIGFSGKVLAQTGFLKKAGIEQASVLDDDLDDETDSIDGFLLTEISFLSSISIDTLSKTVHVSKTHGSKAIELPRWILNQQMKIGDIN